MPYVSRFRSIRDVPTGLSHTDNLVADHIEFQLCLFQRHRPRCLPVHRDRPLLRLPGQLWPVRQCPPQRCHGPERVQGRCHLR